MHHHGLFDPSEYIQMLGDGMALCSNPSADGGMSAITVNLRLSDAARKAFSDSVKRMVLSKLFSPKFAEVILCALETGQQQEAERRRA